MANAIAVCLVDQALFDDFFIVLLVVLLFPYEVKEAMSNAVIDIGAVVSFR